jgi:putative heme-binding domain-containing protein
MNVFRCLVAFALGLLFLCKSSIAQEAKLKLEPGAHVCIIGNTLAERMQHHGWLETYLQAAYSEHKLVFRNLGYSGDEVDGYRNFNKRLRSMDFGSQDQWLAGNAPIPQPGKLNPNAPVATNRFEKTNTKADVILAFFGYNESFAGENGVSQFKGAVEGFIKHVAEQKYNGKSAPKLVLFSPTAFENLNDPNLPSGDEINARLKVYSQAMAEIAAKNSVAFVDLLTPTLKAFSQESGAQTINGVHLNESGDQIAARIAFEELLGKEAPAQSDLINKLRAAVNRKNFYWFNRYRTTDGYSTYGDRAFLKFVDGQTNYEVMQRELEILDVLTSNHEEQVWAIASGADAQLRTDNIPAYVPVTSNKPGPLEGGKHAFLSGEAAIEKMKLPAGFKVELFATEEKFPELVNPVQMAFDTKGRLWVAVWPSYPHWMPTVSMDDKLLILEDTNGDGKADVCKTFCGDLQNPTGFEFYGGGVLVAQGPDLLFLKDTNGDDKYDLKERVVHGLDTADTHHTVNSFVLDPGGALYMQEGTFHHTQVESPWGPPRRVANGAVFRYEPKSQKFDVYVSHGFANPHGHIFDRWGQGIVYDGTGSNPYHDTLFSGHVEFPQKHQRPPQVYQQRTRPCPGVELLSSSHFPSEMQGNLLVGNVIGFLGILRYKVIDNGSSFRAEEQEPLVSSDDPNFRPSDFEFAPDGTLFFTDWHNPIIGHMQHNLRDPSRDKIHGRVYRVVNTNLPLVTPPAIAHRPIPELLELMKHPDDRIRYRAKIELSDRDSTDVVAAVKEWIAGLSNQDPHFEHQMMEALWLHQYHNVVDLPLLNRMLRSSEPRARAAATRVLCYWRDRVPGALELVRTQIQDPSPKVRLEAIRTLSFFSGAEADVAQAIAVEMYSHPDDEYLRFVFAESLATLERASGGGRVDRRNIAASMLRMIENGRMPTDRVPAMIETICKRGGPAELAAIWRKAQESSCPPELRRKIFVWLADAAITRRTKPEGEIKVADLLQPANSTDLVELVKLAAAWKAADAAKIVRGLASGAETSVEARAAAIAALSAYGDGDSKSVLEKLAGDDQPLNVRFLAAASLAQIDTSVGSKLAARAIAKSSASDDVSGVVEAILAQKGGAEAFAAALQTQQIDVDGAKRLLRAMYLAGRNDAALSDVLSKFAKLDATPNVPGPEDVAKLVAEVGARGDAKRGEQVFRRADLGCMKCHAVSKAGGDIGPELSSLGGISPVDYIVRSVLDPNASIKEQYLTKLITTDDGRIITGIVTSRDKDQVTLKDATGKLVRIPVTSIDEELEGKSLMPEGITKILTKDEVLDLIRFVSELGKPGAYATRDVTTIQRWKVLQVVPEALKAAEPNREELREKLLRADNDAWGVVFSDVVGSLKLAEAVKPASTDAIYLQGEFRLLRQGKVQLEITADGPVTAWLDEESVKPGAPITTEPLVGGLHKVTIRVPSGASTKSVKVDVRRPTGVASSIEILHAGP